MRRRAVLLGIGLFALLLAGTAFAAVGDLTQKAGTAGCVSDTGSAGACADGTELDGPLGVAASPDGKSVYMVSENSSSIAVFDRSVTGELAQKPGTAGCISDTGSGGACIDGVALSTPTSAAVSPDGASVYVASDASDAVAIFDRDTTTGALTQKAGTAGCISETGAGPCVDGAGLDNPEWVAVSPDGASVYTTATGSDSIAIFDRDTTTGALTQKPGAAGCISETGGGGCTDGTAINGPRSVVVAPGGATAYVASDISDAVSIFDRDTTTGALTQKPGTAGCISDTGAGPCVDGNSLTNPQEVTASFDGTGAYVVSAVSDSIAVFDRNTTTGALTQKPGAVGCISETGASGCADGTALDGPFAVELSADGANAYVASSVSDAVAVFDRDTTTGALTQKPGVAGCISDTGAGGCADGVALETVRSLAMPTDGASLYAVSLNPDAVVVLDREIPVDTEPPDTRFTKKPKKKLRTEKAKAKAKAKFSSEAGARFECKLDKGKFKECSSPFKAKVKAKPRKGKKHTLYVRAIDAAGNVETEPAKASFRAIRRS